MKNRYIFFILGILLISIASAALIYDNFDDDSFDITKWTNDSFVSGAGANSHLQETGGQIDVSSTIGGASEYSLTNLTTIEDYVTPLNFTITAMSTAGFGGGGKWGDCSLYIGGERIIYINRTTGVTTGNWSIGNWTVYTSGADTIVANETGTIRTITGTVVTGKITWECVTESTAVGGGSNADLSLDNVYFIEGELVNPLKITLNIPVNNSVFVETNKIFNVTIKPSNSSGFWNNITNATFWIWNSDGTFFNSTVNLTVFQNVSTYVYMNISNFTTLNSYIWNVEGCESNTTFWNCTMAENNYTFEVSPYNILGETYNYSTYETDDQEFKINISIINDVDSIGVFLHYNNTAYAASHSCVGATCYLSRTIDIPLLSGDQEFENKSFFWQITFFGSGLDSVTKNSTTHYQNVSNISLINCNGESMPNAINFTLINESTTNIASGDFKATFSYYLGLGSVTESYNYSGAGNNNYGFCLNNNVSLVTSSDIQIKNETHIRNYYFNKEIYSNVTTFKTLYFPGDDYTNVIVEVKNQGLVPLEDIIVNISRYFPESNLYRQVESKKTDEYGQFVAKLVESDAQYKFAFYDINGVLLKTSDKITISCKSTVCILPFIIEDTSDYFSRFDDLSLFTKSLTWNNNTYTFTYSWDDQRQEVASYRLEVTRFTLNQTTNVYNGTSTSKLSTLTYNVGNQKASYKAQAFRTVNGVTTRVSLLQVEVGETYGLFGVEGLLWSFILLFTCIAIGAYNPTAGAALFGVSFVTLGIIGIISMPLPVFFGVVAMVVVFIWAVNT